MCLRTKGMSESTAIFSVEATGQVYNQTNEFVHLGGNVNHNADVSKMQRMVQLPDAHPQNERPTERSPRAQNTDAKSRGARDNVVRLRHVEPARGPLRHAAPSPPQVPDSLHRLSKNNRTDHPISYVDTLIKTGSESIEEADLVRGICDAHE